MVDDTVAQLPRSRGEAASLGIVRYFTGNPCPKGHVTARYTKSAKCVICQRLRGARQKKLPHIIAQRHQYYEAHKEKLHEQTKRWHEAHPDIVRAYANAWQKRNPDYRRAQVAKRRARIRTGKDGSFTAKELANLREHQKKCHICGKPFTKKNPGSIDHIMPLALGGQHVATNILLAHLSCNKSKAAKRTHLL